jgi:GNAT superfamily N-acetyltransferase
MQVTSLGFRTDVALRVLEGAETTDRGDYLVVRTRDNPDFYWGNFLLLGAWPEPGSADGWLARFAAEFPAARHVALGVDAESDMPVPASGRLGGVVFPQGGSGGMGPPGKERASGASGAPEEFRAAGLEPERATVLTCVGTGVVPPPRPSTEAEIRRLESDDDWQQSLQLAIRCFGDSGSYLSHRAAARRRITREGRGAWFGAFTAGRLVAQLGVCDAGQGLVRYQDVETDPAARRRGLAGTLVWRAGRYAAEAFAARLLVIVADPAENAIRVYRGCGFADAQSQFSFERQPAE